MSTRAITPDYHGEMKDTVDRFHGKQLLNIGWDQHLMYAAPICIPVPPELPFGALIEQVLPTLYGGHPDFGRIDWGRVVWLRSGQPFIPDRSKSLVDNGLGHKAMLRMRTLDLTGLRGACN